MIHFNSFILIEFLVGLFLWWVGVYLLVQNPFSRLVQLLFGIFTAISFYLSSDLFFNAANISHQYVLDGTLLKIFAWTIYLPAPLLFHVSLLLIPIDKRKLWQKICLYLAYIATAIIIFVESGTNLTRDHSVFASSNFTGNYADATGKYFWLLGVFFMAIFIGTTINFYLLLKNQQRFTRNWYKYFWPFLGLVSTLILGPIIMLGYYNVIPHSEIYVFIWMTSLSASLVYSIIKYDLLIEEAKIIFGKSFIFSSLVMLLVSFFYFIALVSGGNQFTSVKSLITPFILAYLIIISHPLYDWLSTFAKDIMYNISSGISVVNDEEVYQAVRSYNNPEKLEDSSLLRLSLIDQEKKKNNETSPVNALRKITKDSIDYFKPESEPSRRIKKNLKYQILKMIAYDQAEEGQILWELGFEEYPVAIMTRETRERKPLFKIESPSDYYYISRNAYLALKKEAIHDVTWRISYLEKLSKNGRN